MNTNNYSNNGRAKKHPTFHHSKNSRGMKLLYHPSTVITVGKYAGKTFGYILKTFGKKAFPELLKYYRICSRIMIENHCTLKPHQEMTSRELASNDKVTVPMIEEDASGAADVNVSDQVTKVVDYCDALDTIDLVEIDDNKWASSRSDYENNVLYDPEDDMPDSYIDDLWVA